MKVVKCLEHITKELWGFVYNELAVSVAMDDELVEEFCGLKQSDTFPLPEQGDKVEVSDDGLDWEFANWDEDDKDNHPIFISYNAIVNKGSKFVIAEQKRPDMTYSYKYIRPIEAKEESNDTNSLKHLTTDNKVMTTVGRNYRIELKIEHELVYDKHDDGTFTPVINMDVKDVSLIPIKTDKS